MYTDDELLNDIIKQDISNRFGVTWFEPMATQILHFATCGVLMDNQFFARTCTACMKIFHPLVFCSVNICLDFNDVTFEEAHSRTGRVITITLTKSSRGAQGMDADVVLLNYVTSPHVLLRR